MSVLTQKLQEASKLFQAHNFRKSLQAYEGCLEFCKRTKEEDSVIFNILSTKATIEYILGDFDKALSTLNSVLSKDRTHFLCLLRRSQVYKKKNKLHRALRDLEAIQVYCPDNLQISAFKVEIEHLLLVQGSTAAVSSDSSDEEENEQESLNFANLKLIDRKSSDMSKVKERKSRVTILGDTTFQYLKEEDGLDTAEEEKNENISDKALRTYKQIELDQSIGSEESVNLSIKISGPKSAKKSILKNKGTSIFIQPEDEESRKSKYLGRQSKLLNLLKNIDGKLIQSTELEHDSNKEVIFRKSVSQIAPLQQFLQPTSSIISQKSAISESQKRKSCLKRSSFELSESKRPLRRSKFQEIDANKIDGKLIVHKIHHQRNSLENKSPVQLKDIVAQSSDSDNDSSSHNIFGSKGVVMSPDLKEKLGLVEPQLSMTKSLDVHKKMSILKKNSSLIMSSRKTSMKKPEQLPLNSGDKSLKSKKSVMFNCTL